MKIRGWVAALAISLAGAAQAQAPSPGVPRPALTIAKVVSSIPDGTEWAVLQSEPFCGAAGRLQWNVGKETLDVSRLAQPVRDELRREGVRPAADPDEPFGVASSDLMAAATITKLTAKMCGAEEVKGLVQMQVVWEIYSNSQKRIVVAVRTNATVDLRDQRLPPLRLIGEAMRESTIQLLKNEDFRRVLFASVGSAGPDAIPGGPPANAAGQYGPGVAHGDLLPHPQALLPLDGSITAKAVRINDSVDSVVLIIRPRETGSGFLASSDGYVLTAAHVVGADKFVKIRWSDGFETTGEVVRSDARRDVALIKTDPRGRRVLPLRPQVPTPGDGVYAVGAPLGTGFQGTISHGVASANRVLQGFGFIQSDVTINPGNSGGPLFNETGEVIGIADLSVRNRNGASDSVGQGLGLNFFVPIGDALLFLGAERR